MSTTLSHRQETAPSCALAHPATLYYPGFDWLRAICASVVMLYHDGVIRIANSGNFAVQIFFALSGWLIGGILLKQNPSDLPRFYFNRAIRIWIPYYLGVALLLAISIAREPITSKWLEFVSYKLLFVWNLFGTQQLADYASIMPQKGTLNHVWSVNAEEQFYLLAPLLLVIGARFFGRSLILWGALSFAAWASDTYAAIFFGVLAALAHDRWGPAHLTHWGRSLLCMGLAFSLFAYHEGANYKMLAPFAAICIVLLLAQPGTQHKYGHLFGGMSYPLYLNHWIGPFTFNYLLHEFTPIRVILAATLNIALAMAMYWFIDRGLIAQRDKLFTVQRARIVTWAAYLMVICGITLGLYLRASPT